MRTKLVIGFVALALVSGALTGAVEPVAGLQCEPPECPDPVTPTPVLTPTPNPPPPSGGQKNDGGRQGQEGGRHGQDGGRHGRLEGRPNLVSLVRGGVTRRAVSVVIDPIDVFPDFPFDDIPTRR